MSGLLSVFRKKYGCHHVLTRLIEDCKHALDKHMHVGLLLLDLSKTFDCFPHKLLLLKLHAYGVSRDACCLLCSYLTNRSQRVKISSVKSDWAKLIKGVPEGSVSGGRFKNTYELLNLRALKTSMLYKSHIFQCMGKIFCVEFQRYPLKFHMKYLTHALNDLIFMQFWNFKSS